MVWSMDWQMKCHGLETGGNDCGKYVIHSLFSDVNIIIILSTCNYRKANACQCANSLRIRRVCLYIIHIAKVLHSHCTQNERMCSCCSICAKTYLYLNQSYLCQSFPLKIYNDWTFNEVFECLTTAPFTLCVPSSHQFWYLILGEVEL